MILRQSNYSGIIAFIGNTEFATGLWIGVELDAPLGENLKYMYLELEMGKKLRDEFFDSSFVPNTNNFGLDKKYM